MSEQDKTPEIKEEEKVVPREAFEKLMKEKKNAMSALEESKTKIAAYEASLKEKEEALLSVKEDHKTRAENWQKEAIEWKNKFTQVEEKQARDAKLSTVKKEFEKMGADSKSMEVLLRLVDLESLKFDAENKIVLGADGEALRVKEQLPQVFGTQTPGAGHDAPNGTIANLNVDAFKGLSLADKKKNEAAMYEKAGITMRK